MKLNKSSVKLFLDFFENSPVGMAVIDEDNSILYSNSSFCDMTSYAEDGQKDNLLQFIYSKDKVKFNKSFGELLSGKINTFKIEIRYTSENNPSEIKWWNLKIASANEDDNEKFIFCIMEDITLSKIETNKLKLEKDYAEKITKMKSDFLANMSHEIRTPIHTIIGMNELLLDTKLDEEQIEYTEQIKFSADVLLSLINDILDFSKIEAGKLHLESVNFDLDKLVEEAVNLAVLDAHKKGLEVCIFIDNRIPNYLIGDPVRIRQIITNFFSNAVKFTAKGEIVISVDLLEKAGKYINIKFSVKDTGIGIAPQKLEKLFKSFSQIDTSVTRVYGGTGLGLSISKNLVKLMKGGIGVESAEKKGSTFWFTVKLKSQIEENIDYILRMDFGRGVNVLIVDDNNSGRMILKQYLLDIGCIVTEVKNGFQAIELINEKAKDLFFYDICFVDLLIPGMDGWQIASILSEKGIIKRTKLILLSPLGKSAEEAKMKLLNWYSFYISKPVKKSDIYRVISWFKNSQIDFDDIEELSVLKIDDIETKKDSTNYKVLVAEDHEVNQKLFKTVLENLGYEVLVVNNGFDAVQVSEFADLIFMDVNMPRMDGINASQKIREKGLDTPIIAITASIISSDKEKCLKAGMNDMLTKPFKKKDIIPILNKWLHSDIKELNDNPNEDAEILLGVIDFEKAVKNFMNNKEVVLDLLKVFKKKTEDQLFFIREALLNRDYKRISDEAHSLKSSAMSLEITPLGEDAKLLEKYALNNLQEETIKYIQQVEEDFKNFTIVAEKILADNNKL